MPAQTDPTDVSSVTDATYLVTVAARAIVVAVTCDTLKPYSPPFRCIGKTRKERFCARRNKINL